MNRKTSTLLSIGISAALVAAAIGFLFSRHADLWMRGPGWRMPHGMMMGGGTGLLGILFWLVVIVALVFLVSAAFPSRTASGHRESAIDILKKRYARGEIDKARFDAMRRDIEENKVITH